MKKFRFKTKEEFQKEFGTYWRDDVPLEWSTDMDHFLGKKVPENIVKDILYKGISHRSENGTGFVFNKNMITPMEDTPMEEKPVRGRIIVITHNNFGNKPGTITKIVETNTKEQLLKYMEKHLILAEAVTSVKHSRAHEHFNKPCWYERYWRYADEEEKSAWRKGKRMSPKFDKTYQRFL